MIIHTSITLLVIIWMFIYTVGFALQLWKDKKKPGAWAVLTLALTVAVLPFFTILQ